MMDSNIDGFDGAEHNDYKIGSIERISEKKER